MKNFGEQWKVFENVKNKDDPDTPTITKDLPVIRWVEAFEDHRHRCIGVRCVPLAYVIRAVVELEKLTKHTRLRMSRWKVIL